MCAEAREDLLEVLPVTLPRQIIYVPMKKNQFKTKPWHLKAPAGDFLPVVTIGALHLR
jgi:hypothetical protein